MLVIWFIRKYFEVSINQKTNHGNQFSKIVFSSENSDPITGNITQKANLNGKPAFVFAFTLINENNTIEFFPIRKFRLI